MIATLHIQTAFLNGATYIAKSFATTPFKVANISEDKKAGPLKLMLMSSSPGILDGDNYTIKFELGESSNLQLHTQSYQRLFNMKKGAMQQAEFILSHNCSFCFVAHPVVPHGLSDFKTKSKIYLSANCSLIYGELLTCGRKLNTEVFLLSRYHSIVEIFLHGKLVVKENLLLVPAETSLTAIGQMQQYTHQASLIYLNEKADAEATRLAVAGLLAYQKDISFGISKAPVNGLIIRILGQKAEQLFDCLKAIAGILPQSVNHKPTAYAI